MKKSSINLKIRKISNFIIKYFKCFYKISKFLSEHALKNTFGNILYA